MKRILCVLLVMLMVTAVFPVSAEGTLTEQLLQEMAEAGQIDQITPWAFPGVYCFGENMEAPYITLTTADDVDKILGSVSWRLSPNSPCDLDTKFFPMLRVMMYKFCEETDKPLIDAWLLRQMADMDAAWLGLYDQKSHTQMFLNYEIYIKYDVDYNELYTLLTPIRDSQYLLVK